MQFTQDEEERKQNEVPYFEDVTSQDGWAGQTTTKSIEELKSEITTSITRLGGYVTAIKKGKFVSDEHFRDGFVIEYQIPGSLNIHLKIQMKQSEKEKSNGKLQTF